MGKPQLPVLFYENTIESVIGVGATFFLASCANLSQGNIINVKI